jgi:hypothetical protein
MDVKVSDLGLVGRIHFRIRIAFALFAEPIALHRIDRSLFRTFAFASQIRVFAFSLSHFCYELNF